jgi:hypothetical protein
MKAPEAYVDAARVLREEESGDLEDEEAEDEDEDEGETGLTEMVMDDGWTTVAARVGDVSSICVSEFCCCARTASALSGALPRPKKRGSLGSTVAHATHNGA